MKKSLALIFGLLLSCSVFAKSYSVFKYDNKYGVIDSNRKVVLSPQYEKITRNEEFFFFCYDSTGKIDIYNSTVKLIHSLPEDTSITRYSDYEYLVKEKSSKPFYLLNLKTGEISDYEKSKEYVWNYSYVDGLALVLEMNAKNADYSIVDKKGNVVLQNIEQANFYYSEGMLAVQMSDGSSGFVDKTGKFVIKTSFYRNLEDEGPRKSPSIQYFFNEGLAIVQSEKDVWEIFDTKGKKVQIPDSIQVVARYFSNKLVVIVDKNNKYGYMNPKAEVAIPYKFDSASNFIGDYAMVVYDSKDAVVDSKGRIYFCEEIMKKNKL